MDTVVTPQDVDFVNWNKDRIRRRLQDRYLCPIVGHTHCYANRDGVHLALSEDVIETWVNCVHNCESTILNPPESVVPFLKKVGVSDVVSVRSLASYYLPQSSAKSSVSGNAIEYQRILRKGGRHSLTDIRSLRNRFVTSSNSSASSGVIGPGYLSGKAVKWVGNKLLQGVGQIEVRRRRWIIGRFITNLARVTPADRCAWIVKKVHKMNQATEDLLELSLGPYKKNFQTSSIEQGAKLQLLIFQSCVDRERGNAILPIGLKLFPLALLNTYPSECAGFASDLREILLQERFEDDDEDAIAFDILTHLCYELAYSAWSPWHIVGYHVLWRFYRTSVGSQAVQTLGRRGNLIKALSDKTFKTEIQDRAEHALAVQFFVAYADDVPEFQLPVSAPLGIPLLITRFRDIDDEMKLNHVRSAGGQELGTLGAISHYAWCALIISESDICSTSINLLACNPVEPGDGEKLLKLAWADWELVCLLGNIVHLGGTNGRHAIRAGISPKLRLVLHQLVVRIQRVLGDPSGQRAQAHVSNIEKLLDMPQSELLDKTAPKLIT